MSTRDDGFEWSVTGPVIVHAYRDLGSGVRSSPRAEDTDLFILPQTVHPAFVLCSLFTSTPGSLLLRTGVPWQFAEPVLLGILG